MKKVFAGIVTAVICLALSGEWQKAGSAPQSTTAKSPQPGAKATEGARLNNLGAAYMNQQSFEKALKYFQEAYAADPQLHAARLNEGIALLNLQRVAEALPILQEAVKRDPKDSRAWYNLGLLHKSSGDAEQALGAFKKAVELSANNPDAHYFLGLAYSQTGANNKAATEFQEALKLFPFHASAEFGLARAYQKLGDPEQAKTHLARFQHLTRAKLGSPITLAYGEQGTLSLVESVGGGTQTADLAIPVKFVDATQRSGLTGKPSNGTNNSVMGAGACVLDFDNDGQPDIFFTGFSASGGTGLFRDVGEAKFSEVTKVAGLSSDSPALACAAADYDNDGKTDLAVAYVDHVELYHNEGGKFRDVTDEVGLKAKVTSRGLLFVDYDHDGDADLLVTTANSGGQLWRNNGNSTFTDATSENEMTFEGSGTAAVASDVNNDRAVDVVVTRDGAAPVLFTNPREGKWTASSPWPESAKGATSITSLDFNKDGWMDFALTTASAPGLVLLRNVDGHQFEQVPLPAAGWSRGLSVVAIDYDNDGFVDLVASGVAANGKFEIKQFRNLGVGKFEDVTANTGLDRVQLRGEAFLSTADLDGDGDIDLIVTQIGNQAILLRNDGGNRNKSLRISLKGLADNKSGLGTKVEVFAGDLWQKWEVHSGGSAGQSSTDIIAGLGKRTQVDVVRMLWPTGVIQDEIDVPLTKQQMVEIDRRGSSCPVLFAWDGKHYQFISDMIGSGVVGHWVGPGERNVPDPTEYLKVSGDLVTTRNGRLSFRFMEPMEEVVYLDQLRLLAVDHPASYDVYPNEYFASSPPFPQFKVIAARRNDVRLPTGAWDEHGRDVLAHLLNRDHDYVSGFKVLNYSGYTEPHSLELDLGEPYKGGTLRLLMHGFIEYFTATSMYAAHQAGLDPVAPYVEALDPNGKWVRVVEDMGFPAGLPRTTVADLTGKLPNGTQRIRIGTNLQIYWDQILIDRTASSATTHVQDVQLSSAQLRFHGYPSDIEHKTNAHGDHYYVYEEVSKTGPYARQAGAYTRLGDVKKLVANKDDQFAVFGSGDVIELDFDPSRLGTLPKGWVRDYFFFADGYEKDMDFYAAEGLTVDPLPYSKMKKYPYSQEDGFLQGKSSVDYLLDYNTRFFTGSPSGVRSSYRFKQ